MNFENALELAVVSSWPELVKPGEHCAIHVEYHDKPGAAVDSLQVWTIGNKGHGALICDYSLSASRGSPTRMRRRPSSKVSISLCRTSHNLAVPPDHCVNGLVQVGFHSKEEQATMARSWRSHMTELARKADTLKKEKNVATLN